jgi:hypothetical protein
LKPRHVSGTANLHEPVLLLLKVGFLDDMLPRFRKTGGEFPRAIGNGFLWMSESEC